jgi:GNAT superfamily N-acetyltransferase
MSANIVVRAAAPSDRARIEAMHARCSLASRSDRWHAPLRVVPARYLADALSGRPGHVCSVATDGRDVLGIASAVRGFGGRWDLGVLVRDDMQRRGVGLRLIACVIAGASTRGAIHVAADLTPARRYLLGWLRRYGTVAAVIDRDGIHAQVALASASGRGDVDAQFCQV